MVMLVGSFLSTFWIDWEVNIQPLFLSLTSTTLYMPKFYPKSKNVCVLTLLPENTFWMSSSCILNSSSTATTTLPLFITLLATNPISNFLGIQFIFPSIVSPSLPLTLDRPSLSIQRMQNTPTLTEDQIRALIKKTVQNAQEQMVGAFQYPQRSLSLSLFACF